jgi:ParB family chromosome partitioning protein
LKDEPLKSNPLNMAKKVQKKELGRGIRALLGNIDEEIKTDAPSVVKELNSSIIELPIENIEINPFQPRTEFDPEFLEELANSIATFGVIQPITVRRLGPDAYQLISGERRLRASKMAGMVEIPAYIRLANDQELLEMALVENIQRRDLNAIEVAISYQRLMEECSLTHEKLSERIGKDRSTVTNYTRLLKLPPEIQRSLKKEEISMGHAKALAGINDIALQISVLHKIKSDGLSVRATEELIRRYQQPKKEKSSNTSGQYSQAYKNVEKQLSNTLDTKVAIKTIGNTDKGTIAIHFNDLEEFNRILEIIEGN